MSQAEQEQQQGAFGPLTKRRSADGGHQHQRVDLEALCPKVVERLANRVVAAEEIGRDVQRRGQPRRPGDHAFEQPANAQQRAGSDGEDEFGPLAERAAGVRVAGVVTGCLGVVVAGVIAIFLAVLMAGVAVRFRRVCRCLIGRLEAQRGGVFQQGLRRHLLAVVFDPYRARSCDIGFEHARHAAQPVGNAARGARMQRRVGAHDQMPEALADLRARGMNQLSNATDVDLRRVVMDAQLRRSAVARDVRLGDAGPSRQRGDQPADAAVVGIIDLGQQQWQVEPQPGCWFVHRHSLSVLCGRGGQRSIVGEPQCACRCRGTACASPEREEAER